MWWQAWAKVTLEEVLNCPLTRWTSPANILQPFPYFCAFSPFIYCSPPPLLFLRNPQGLAANLLLLRALLFLHFCHQGSSSHLGKNWNTDTWNASKELPQVPVGSTLSSRALSWEMFPNTFKSSLANKRSKTQPENTFLQRWHNLRAVHITLTPEHSSQPPSLGIKVFTWALDTSHTACQRQREDTGSETALLYPGLTLHGSGKHPDTSVSQVTGFLLISEHFSTLPPWEALFSDCFFCYMTGFSSWLLIHCIGGEVKN